MSKRKVLILVVAVLVGMGAWGIYAGQEAQAGISIPHFKCYETTGTPLNEPLRVFDPFHDGPPSPSTGGELVTVKGSHLVCTQVYAKCFPGDPGRCEFLPIEFSRSAGVNCYKITSGPPVNETVPVEDQFGEHDLKVGKAKFFCAPALFGDGG
ncbi:MAG: hypothetical protein DMD81_17330 [Candidatus Rokuibacteriota bacterium]|nr:MAG: hypothetical protein DMD81_17330 [Candidatus Rokubacteria bacterium]